MTRYNQDNTRVSTDCYTRDTQEMKDSNNISRTRI